MRSSRSEAHRKRSFSAERLLSSVKLAQGFWGPTLSAARCIVPMRGYFEWTGDKTPETPHFLRGKGLLSAAGLTWLMELPNGEKSRCFVVITREARDASGEVHDRMTAFLTPDTWDAWLTPEKLTGTCRRQVDLR